VGGAARNARKKRQARTATGQAPAPAPRKAPTPAPETRRGPVDRKKIVIGAVVVVLLVGAVLGGVIYTNSQKNATEGQRIATVSSETSYPARRDGAVVVVGEDGADVTLDVYEDFLCPACGTFEEQYGDDLERHVADGTVQVRYHMLPMLNERSDPVGYSMDAANAGLCAADAGKYPEFHLSLFRAQPEEGARGWDSQQLVRLGRDLGITAPAFESCVEGDEYDGLIRTHFDEVRGTPYLRQDHDGEKLFGTPTIAVGEKVVQPSEEDWLDKLVRDA
jgi:protein-disulfide isomerase